MSVLAFAGAASLCTPGTVLKRDPSVGEHPAVCGAVRLCAWKYQRSATEYPSFALQWLCAEEWVLCTAGTLHEKHVQLLRATA